MKLLKRRVLASVMSILILSSCVQLISFAEGEVAEHPVYAKKGADVRFDSVELSAIQKTLGQNNEDIELLETAQKMVSALGTEAFRKFMENENYNIKINFGSMESVINSVDPSLNITEWGCEENTVSIENKTNDKINAHIGIDFDDICDIKGIELRNAEELANVEINAGNKTENMELTLNGGQINGNLNATVLRTLYENNGKVEIGTAKVYITNEQVSESIKRAAIKLKEYAGNTQKSIDKLSDAQNGTKNAAQNLVKAAEALENEADIASSQYKTNVNNFVESLKNQKGNLNKIKPTLGYKEELSESIAKFAEANKKLTESVNSSVPTIDTVDKVDTPSVSQSDESSTSSTSSSSRSSGKRKVSLEEAKKALIKSKK